MNARNLRPANTAAAALVIGGVLVVMLPQHAPSILRVVIVTIAATTGLYALAVNSPPAWGSPFQRGIRWRRGARGPGEVAWIRSRLWGWRRRVGRAPALPREVRDMLRPLVVTALQRQGVDPHDDAGRATARRLLSPLSWAVLTGESRGPLAWLQARPPNRRRVAGLVHRVLDDLDRLGAGGTAATLRDARTARP
jgi:hypothetical protein